jgi:hypothetical protein
MQREKASSNMEAAKTLQAIINVAKSAPETPATPASALPGIANTPQSVITPQSKGIKRTQDEIDTPASTPGVVESINNVPQDIIRFGEDGWKERYYRGKFVWS